MDDSKTPLPNGSNGRSNSGRFAKGNRGGPGNPYARRVAHLRTVILDEVTEDDLRAMVRKLIELAKAGDIAANREILTRLVGKPVDSPHPDRLDVDEPQIKADRLEAERLARLRKPSALDLLGDQF